MTQLSDSVPTANLVFYRTYSRRNERRETWEEVCDRTIKGLTEAGKLTPEETELIDRMQRELKCLPSGRWLWVGGTEWLAKSDNFPGAFNCTSTNVINWRSFASLMNLAMMGCGTGAVLEPKYIEQLPVIRNRLEVKIVGEIGEKERGDRVEETTILTRDRGNIRIEVGDSRDGWVGSYWALLESSQYIEFDNSVLTVEIDLSSVRPEGEKLNGFGGVSNPAKLRGMYERCAAILNKAVGRKLTSVECCLLIDEAATVVVAGNVRRSAGMRQGDSRDEGFAIAKDNLWQKTESGWRIDPERDALRMANHTRTFHHKPTKEECLDSVRKQYYSGEGAVQWTGEAIARANADLLRFNYQKREFIEAYLAGNAREWLEKNYPKMDADEVEHRLQRYGLNPCGEIIGSDFFCNLAEIHLNRLDPMDLEEQEDAFIAGAIAVCSLLHRQFTEPRYQHSRELDPIVGVSFTGLFDFFVKAFGVEWLRWWAEGRPQTSQGLRFLKKEACYLNQWREIVEQTVFDYCDAHNLKVPNRCTTVQPAGSKSLLTGASPGWHPPKAQRFIRRITFRKNDPVALAALDYGYSVLPAQSDKDEEGNLLNDPFDPRCTEWLVEVPVAVPWADIPGVDQIDISKFSALAQFDFYMQVQKNYTRHNTSATIEVREHEIEELSDRIYQAIQDDEGYISTTLLARFDDKETFPRLPFEPISKEKFEELSEEVLARRKAFSFYDALIQHDDGELIEAGPAGCDSDKCLLS